MKSCLFNDIDILKTLISYCFRYNFIFDIHYNDDEAWYYACLHNSIEVLLYLITLNKKYYYLQWNFNDRLLNLPLLEPPNIELNNKVYATFKYFFNMKHVLNYTNLYIFKNNIVSIDEYHLWIFDETYISYISYVLCLNT